MINDILGEAATLKFYQSIFWHSFYDFWLFLISNKVPLKESSVLKHVGMKYFF